MHVRSCDGSHAQTNLPTALLHVAAVAHDQHGSGDLRAGHGTDAALRDSGFGSPRGQSVGSAPDSRDNKDLEGQREIPLVQAAAERI